MRAEPCEEDQSINIILRSGMTMGKDKGTQPKEDICVRKAPKKEATFDLNRAKETFTEAKKSFVEASTSRSQENTRETNTTQYVDLFILDLGYDANFLPKQTWERMGILELQWSSIQLRMVN